MEPLTEQQLEELLQRGISTWTDQEKTMVFEISQRVWSGEVHNQTELGLYNQLREFFDDPTPTYDNYDDVEEFSGM